jgi:hypothetical protein
MIETAHPFNSLIADDPVSVVWPVLRCSRGLLDRDRRVRPGCEPCGEPEIGLDRLLHFVKGSIRCLSSIKVVEKIEGESEVE